MGRIDDRLAELSITLTDPPAPAGAYVPAIVDGDHVLTSGQLPLVDGALPVTGHVGAEVDPEQAADLARTCALNALAAVDAWAAASGTDARAGTQVAAALDALLGVEI